MALVVQENERPTMQEVWMKAALLLSKRSTCSRAQVGAIITTKNLRHVLGNGYNGSPAGQPNECLSTEPGSCGHIHSEMNAMLDSGSEPRDKVMFVTTLPCVVCARHMVNSGFSAVYYLNDYRLHDSLELLEKAGIVVSRVELKNAHNN